MSRTGDSGAFTFATTEAGNMVMGESPESGNGMSRAALSLDRTGSNPSRPSSASLIAEAAPAVA